jgi:hypothetical protein
VLDHRLDAVDVRHADVHDDDVRVRTQDELDRLAAVLRLTDDLDVVGGIEHRANAAAHDRLVVDDDDLERPHE